MSPSKNWLRGYHVSFEPTGVYVIDVILSAVARAGKAFHYTEDWGTECGLYEPDIHRGETPMDWIQNAAIDAAAVYTPAPAVPPEYERAVEALRGLASWTDDVLRGWQAHKKLAEGFSGMGHNIIVEDAGKYGSMSVWLRVERALAEARTALAAVDAARGKR